IFAQSILTFPAVIAAFFQRSGSTWVANAATTISNVFGSQGGALLGSQILYWTIYFLMVVGFTYLYTDIMITNQNLAYNLQRNGGLISGILPGRQTEEFINRLVTPITLVAALFHGFVAVLPGIVQIAMNRIKPGSGLEVRNALYII